ncbi:hypothetical protein V1478_014869 [Vespula squamosa]|uniref:Uncharacterized protein n=1 Tax=Vespula squamosa TaxID=30214 RepID=A0ABD2A3H5_VESSQ
MERRESSSGRRSLTLKYHSPEQYEESRVEIQGQAILTKNLPLPDSPGLVSSILRVNVSHFVWASKAHWYALRGPACPYGRDGLGKVLENDDDDDEDGDDNDDHDDDDDDRGYRSS